MVIGLEWLPRFGGENCDCQHGREVAVEGLVEIGYRMNKLQVFSATPHNSFAGGFGRSSWDCGSAEKAIIALK
jgi:hypothetical protein